MKTLIQPKITLVGAGPGDPELLTIKGLRALEQAQVVCYDALANSALLELAPASALLVDVGKRAGRHYASQEEINRMLVAYALQYGAVVRLKGGDPLVFGRGHEEMAYAEAFGIATEIIPGISSSIAVPGLQGVPVTARGYAESFWVMTGTTRHGELSADIALAAQSTATVVILMGLRKLDAILAQFMAAGKAATPAMVVVSGSTPQETVVLGSVADLATKMPASEIHGPGIIVIGAVVALHPELARQAALAAA